MFHHRCLRGSLTYLWLLMTFRNTLISISWCIATFSCWYFINCCMALVIMTMKTSVKIYFEIDELKSDKQLRLRQRCFSVNFAKFLRTLFLQNTSGRLLLGYCYRDTSEVYSALFSAFLYIFFLFLWTFPLCKLCWG